MSLQFYNSVKSYSGGCVYLLLDDKFLQSSLDVLTGLLFIVLSFVLT